jgi:hypothetical protein
VALKVSCVGQHAHQKNVEIEIDVEGVFLSLGKAVPVAAGQIGLGLNYE